MRAPESGSDSDELEYDYGAYEDGDDDAYYSRMGVVRRPDDGAAEEEYEQEDEYEQTESRRRPLARRERDGDEEEYDDEKEDESCSASDLALSVHRSEFESDGDWLSQRGGSGDDERHGDDYDENGSRYDDDDDRRSDMRGNDPGYESKEDDGGGHGVSAAEPPLPDAAATGISFSPITSPVRSPRPLPDSSDRVRQLEAALVVQEARAAARIGELEDRLQVVEFEKTEAEMQLEDARIEHTDELRRRVAEAEAAGAVSAHFGGDSGGGRDSQGGRTASKLERRVRELKSELEQRRREKERSERVREDMAEQLEQSATHGALLEQRVAEVTRKMEPDSLRAQVSRLTSENVHLRGYVERLNEEREYITPGGPDGSGDSDLVKEVVSLRAEVRALRFAAKANKKQESLAARRRAADPSADGLSPPLQQAAAAGAASQGFRVLPENAAADDANSAAARDQAGRARRMQRELARVASLLELARAQNHDLNEQLARETTLSDEWSADLVKRLSTQAQEIAGLRDELSRSRSAHEYAALKATREDPNAVITSAEETREQLRVARLRASELERALEEERATSASIAQLAEMQSSKRDARESFLRRRAAEAERASEHLDKRLREQSIKLRRMKRVTKEQLMRVAAKMNGE